MSVDVGYQDQPGNFKTPPEGHRQLDAGMTNQKFILAGIRAATLRAQSTIADLDAIRISLAAGMITPESAYHFYLHTIARDSRDEYEGLSSTFAAARAEADDAAQPSVEGPEVYRVPASTIAAAKYLFKTGDVKRLEHWLDGRSAEEREEIFKQLNGEGDEHGRDA
jgi:hypothetical protein